MANETVTEMEENQRVRLDFNAMPGYQQDAMCRILISCAKKYFEDPAVRADFERWKKERQKEQKKKRKKKS